MKIIKAFCIAFSMYSKIPMPQFEWKDKDMKYILCFFPWIGAVIGCLVYGWGAVCIKFDVGNMCYTLIAVAIPLLITGGIHVDGFVDTMDAFHSYQPRERKLEILKDSHIGAFAVIMLVIYGLLYVGAMSEIQDRDLLSIICAGFFLARCLSGIAVVSFPTAKTDGLLYLFASNAQRKIVKGILYLQLSLCIGIMVFQKPLFGGVIVTSALCAFAYYYYRSRKELGGITGDTAGYFVLLCEGCMVIAAAFLNVVVL